MTKGRKQHERHSFFPHSGNRGLHFLWVAPDGSVRPMTDLNPEPDAPVLRYVGTTVALTIALWVLMGIAWWLFQW